MLFRSPANGSRRRLRPTPGAAGALMSSSNQMPLRFGQPQAMTWNHRQSLKEVLRPVLFRTGNERVLLNHKRRRGLIVDHIAESSTAARFGAVYERGVWIRSGEQASASGVGSEVAATEALRAALPELVTRLGCNRLVDVGCGDWNWMRGLDLPRSEEHTSELQSLMRISYAVFCL